ncbi:hypothetical protein C8T65DRAFT_154604 [Cerioporus squamosus]|nr:hypothetical protein C8T65DRAFT_154604 [Cerioporus squamosus]
MRLVPFLLSVFRGAFAVHGLSPCHSCIYDSLSRAAVIISLRYWAQISELPHKQVLRLRPLTLRHDRASPTYPGPVFSLPSTAEGLDTASKNVADCG